jgi:maltose phosphorylase
MHGQKSGNVRRYRDGGKAQQGYVSIFSTKPNLPGKDSQLNIGPKGFTGEKYGGLLGYRSLLHPVYMATKDQK